MTVDWGDGSGAVTYGDGVTSGDDPITLAVDETWDPPAHQYMDDGDFAVAVGSLRQSDNKTAAAQVQVLVTNVAPVISTPGAPLTAVPLT